MELKLLNELNNENLDLEYLQGNGLKGNIQGPSSLKEYINRVLRNVNFKLTTDLENTEYIEGSPYVQYGTKYERNPKLRKKQ